MERLLSMMLYERIKDLHCDYTLLDDATEIVIFGSRAFGVQTTESDLDVLCIGDGKRLKCRSLDLSWLSEEKKYDDEWLGSELAGHIAQYGIWIRGNGDWRAGTFTSAATIQRKLNRIVSLSSTAVRLWDRLHPIFRSRYDMTIRRELQRLQLLQTNRRIPPTRVLDEEWQHHHSQKLIELRNSIDQLTAYEGQAKVPEILRQRFS